MSNPREYLYRTALNAYRSRLRRIRVAARNTFTGSKPNPIDASEWGVDLLRLRRLAKP
jgi:DNA-directed RNA polymerase specialized sigma24 family protein